MIGRTILHYTILGELGTGAMGRVYLARDDRTDRKVALKFLPGSASPELRERLTREAHAAARLSHPGIVTLYGFEEHGGEPFLVEEYVPGESLGRRLGRGPLGTSETLRLARELSAALAHAHAHGIVHRDLKPDNVMVAEDGSYKIADFGIARLEEATTLTEAGVTIGTLAYLAPECLRGHRGDVRADLFALGAVLYEAVSGRRAFPGSTEAEVMYQVMNESPPPLGLTGTAGQTIERIVFHLLEKEPTRRPASAESVSHVVAGLTAATSGRPAASRSLRSWAPIAGVLALVVALVAGVLWWRGRPPVTADEGEAVAVLYFDNVADPGDREKLGPITGNLLVTSLAQNERMNVLSTQRILDALRQLGRPGTVVDRAAALQVARRVHARRIVTGTVLQQHPFLVMTAEVSDVGSGKVIDAVRIDGEPGQTVFQVVDRLGQELMRRMNRTSETTSLEPVAERTSRDLEAVRLYLEGLDHMTNGRLTDAQKSFEASVTRDSSFAQPWFQLAIVRWWQGEPSDAKADMQRARAVGDRLSPHERAVLEGLDLLVNMRYEAAAKAFTALEPGNPDDKLLAYGQVEASFHSNQMDAAITAARRTLALDSTFTLAGVHLVDALCVTGRLQESEATARALLRRSPQNDLLWSSYLQVLAAQGKRSQVFAGAREWRRLAPARPAEPWLAIAAFNLDSLDVVASEIASLEQLPPFRSQLRMAFDYFRALRSGRFRNAVGIAQRSWRTYPLDGLFPGPAIPPADGISAAVRAGQADRALLFADSVGSRLKRWGLSEASVRSPILGTKIDLGRAREAREEYERLIRMPPAEHYGPADLPWIAVRLLIAERRSAEALRALPVNRYPGPPGLAAGLAQRTRIAALMGAGRSADALGAIDTLLAIPAIWPDQAVEMHLWRGRMLEKLGRTAEASDSYREFLRLWKDADPGTVGIDEAKAALARLEAGSAKLTTGRKP
jgi:serine/threonine-protein kinase